MSLDRSRKHWEDMGDLDPYWAVLTEPGTKHGKWDIEKFLDTGSEEIASLTDAAERLGLPRQHEWALDFGCGVGRLTRALAPHFQNVVGIDISQSMLNRARALNPPANCEFLLNDSDSLPFPSGRFDLIYTALVLQHVPTQESIRRYIAEFVRVLKAGGLLVMQLPSYVPLRRRLQARPRMYALLRSAGVSEQLLYRGLGLHPIPMNFLPESDVVSIIESGGGTILEIAADQRAGPHIPCRVYYASKNG
ncbi:MAG TPA: class I SAM-dependent methyltransferase [Candidatus Sulfotelmatobacter sp.]